MDKIDTRWAKKILSADEYELFRDWFNENYFYDANLRRFVTLCPDYSDPRIVEISRKIKAYFDEYDAHIKEMLKKKEENLE